MWLPGRHIVYLICSVAICAAHIDANYTRDARSLVYALLERSCAFVAPAIDTIERRVRGTLVRPLVWPRTCVVHFRHAALCRRYVKNAMLCNRFWLVSASARSCFVRASASHSYRTFRAFIVMENGIRFFRHPMCRRRSCRFRRILCACVCVYVLLIWLPYSA